MKVELEGSLRKALLKGCLWMVESEGSLEGDQDEASQQLTSSIQHLSVKEKGAVPPLT